MGELRASRAQAVAAMERKRDEGKPIYQCDFACGFEGTFEAVAAHEEVCPRAGGPEAQEEGEEASASEAPQPTYQCDYACGFEGTFAAVSAHEEVCPRAGA